MEKEKEEIMSLNEFIEAVESLTPEEQKLLKEYYNKIHRVQSY